LATATMAAAAAQVYYTLSKKLKSQSTIDDACEESGSGALTDVWFCIGDLHLALAFFSGGR